MRPSAYDEVPAKDTVVEDRDQVKVTFKGGNVFWLEAEGAGTHEVRRGGNAAWDRAEKLRKELNPEYAGPPPAADGEPKDDQAGEGAGAAPDAETPQGEQEAPETDDQDEEDDDEGEPLPPELESDADEEGEAGEPDVAKKYQIGDAVGEIRVVPVDVVADFLADQMGRVALLQGSNDTRRLSRRVRATDGRCAPIFLTKNDLSDPNETPALFSGLETLACAINIGLKRVAVVLLPSGKAGAVQGYISGLARAAMSADGEEDDEMVYRAHSSD